MMCICGQTVYADVFVLILLAEQAVVVVSGVARCNHMAVRNKNCGYKKYHVMHWDFLLFGCVI
jgi:hypothetical protein